MVRRKTRIGGLSSWSLKRPCSSKAWFPILTLVTWKKSVGAGPQGLTREFMLYSTLSAQRFWFVTSLQDKNQIQTERARLKNHAVWKSTSMICESSWTLTLYQATSRYSAYFQSQTDSTLRIVSALESTHTTYQRSCSHLCQSFTWPHHHVSSQPKRKRKKRQKQRSSPRSPLVSRRLSVSLVSKMNTN